MPIPWKLEAPGADPVGGLLVHRDGDVLRSEMTMAKPESTEGRPWGQPLKKLEGAPLNLG